MYIRNQLVIAVLVFNFGMSLQSHAQELNSIALSYTVNLVGSKLGNATVGQVETTLTRDNNIYTASSTTKAQGLAAILMGSDIHYNCEFSTEPGHVLSKKYAGSSKSSEEFQVSYDWEARKINFLDGESLDMPPGYITDTCNMPFAVAMLKEDGLADDVLYVLEGSEKRIRGYKLRSSNQETLETPLGSMETLRITLEREFRPERTLSLWLSLDHDYVPIKIEDARNSRTMSTLVKNIDS